MAEHTRSEIDEFDSSFGFVFEEDIFWFEIRVDDGVFSQKYQGIQDLNRESSNMLHFNWSEMVGLDQVVQADAEQFCYNADMFPEYDEVLYPHNILLIIDILLLCPHQNVYLV